MNIVFDFDGTIVDSSERLYRLFQDLVSESTFSKQEYWRLKRDKVDHRQILETFFQNRSFDEFNSIWMSRIESPEYLSYDKTYSDTIKTLQFLAGKNRLILLTARQSKERLFQELKHLEIDRYFDLVLVTESKMSKRDLLLRNESELFVRTHKDYFISDMGSDIALGNELNYHTIAITRGFMSRERLAEYNPCSFSDNLEGVIDIICGKSVE